MRRARYRTTAELTAVHLHDKDHDKSGIVATIPPDVIIQIYGKSEFLSEMINISGGVASFQFIGRMSPNRLMIHHSTRVLVSNTRQLWYPRGQQDIPFWTDRWHDPRDEDIMLSLRTVCPHCNRTSADALVCTNLGCGKRIADPVQLFARPGRPVQTRTSSVRTLYARSSPPKPS